MAVSIGLKIGTGLLAAAGIGGGGYLIIKAYEPTNLGEKLEHDGIVVLSTDTDVHDKEWEEIVKKYEATNNQNKIDNLELTAPKDPPSDRSENIKKLKDACKKLLSTSLKDNNNLSNNEKLAKNWCIKEAVGATSKQ